MAGLKKKSAITAMAGATKADIEAKKLQALSYLDQGHNIKETAELIGVRRQTVGKWKAQLEGKKEGIKKEDVKHLETTRERMSQNLSKAASLSLSRVIDTIEEATPMQAATIMGICIDKGFLLQNDGATVHKHLIGDLAEGDPE